MLSAVARRHHASRLASSAAAASVAAAVVLQKRDPVVDENISHVEVAGASPVAFHGLGGLSNISVNVDRILTTGTVFPPSSKNCFCESLRVPTMKRQQTMVWLDQTSSHVTLESRYKVDWNNPLGEGGYGAVYLCTDRETGEKRALKMIPKAYTDEDSFQKEMDALLRVRESGSHPNICVLKESFEKRGNYYLVMDLISGGEVFDQLAENGAYSEADAARLVRETASAMAFLHGVGLVHADLKPENLMLSTRNKTDSAIKLVDFGCTEAHKGNNIDFKQVRENTFTTLAYSPPEALSKSKGPLQPSFDMWSMGCILYIMLVGCHPFDPEGCATDEEMEERIKQGPPPLRNSELTEHLSESAINLLEKLMNSRPRRRITAMQMLEHPWVKGQTARTDKIEGSDQRLKGFRRFKSQLEVKVFSDWIAGASSDAAKKTSLMERAFKSLDTHGKGYVTAGDLNRSLTNKGEKHADDEDGKDDPLCLSGFSDLLSDNMENKHYPEGYRMYKEGAKGDAIYFINSGTVEVSTRAGFKTTLSNGQMFGEGALLDEKGRRSATITCKTPVHVVRISKEFYQKFMLSANSDINLTLREQDRARDRDRALKIMRLQTKLVERAFVEGEALFTSGEEGKSIFITEKGVIKIIGDDVMIQPGEIVGEHALLTGLPRNATGVCASKACKAYEMSAKDFSYLFNSSPDMKQSFRDICFRRDFKKAIAKNFGKDFGRNEEELKKAFESMDSDQSGAIGLEEVKGLFKTLYPTLPDDDPIYSQALQSLDLEGTNSITWDEFKKILEC